MEKILMKFSDERNKKFCIRTVIARDEKTEEKYVFKSNVYPEGKAHVQSILKKAKVLAKAYPQVQICPVEAVNAEEIRFDFIAGTSMEKEYRMAMKQNDVPKMEKLLKTHAELLKGSIENRCAFEMTEEFQKVFGLKEWHGDSQALKLSNFDGNASNIIYKEGIPFFIDYEWVFDFPVPVELVVFYNIHDAYMHIHGLEEFYPLEEAKKLLHITIADNVLSDINEAFFSYVYCEDDGVSYALGKHINAKGTKDYYDYDFMEKNWRDASQANALLSQRIQKLERELAETSQALEQEKENHRIHAKQIEDAVQEQARQSEHWRISYEAVINTKAWRIAQKCRRLMGRK